MNTSSTTANSGLTPSTPIIFFGAEDFSAISLKMLIEAGFNIAAVVTKPDSKKGRGQKLAPPLVKTIALEHNLPVWQPTKLSDIHSDILKLQPVAGVLVSFGKIIPKDTLSLFTPGIINLHPSRLPAYRGPSPIESAILNGDKSTAVSIMKISARMDAGPIYAQEGYQLHGNETQAQLYETLGDLGSKLLASSLPGILSGEITGTKQAEKDATYCHMIKKSDGTLNPGLSAAENECRIRAYKSWPGVRWKFGDIEAIITGAHVSDQPSELSVHCFDGKYLCIDSLKPVGKKEMPVKAFLAGYGSRI